MLADVPRLVAESRDAGTEVLLRDEVTDPADAPPPIARTAYRVIQEGLTNARKHADGAAVHLVLTGGPGRGLEIDIRNALTTTGTGPSPGPAGDAGPVGWSGGAGLVGLTERVGLAGGRLDHHMADGEFRLHASLPWPA